MKLILINYSAVTWAPTASRKETVRSGSEYFCKPGPMLDVHRNFL